jgi:hypothetical protein
MVAANHSVNLKGFAVGPDFFAYSTGLYPISPKKNYNGKNLEITQLDAVYHESLAQCSADRVERYQSRITILAISIAIHRTTQRPSTHHQRRLFATS